MLLCCPDLNPQYAWQVQTFREKHCYMLQDMKYAIFSWEKMNYACSLNLSHFPDHHWLFYLVNIFQALPDFIHQHNRMLLIFACVY